MTKDQIIKEQRAVIEQQQKLIEQQQKQIEQILLSQPPVPVVVPYPVPYPDRRPAYDPPWRDRIWAKSDNTTDSIELGFTS